MSRFAPAEAMKLMRSPGLIRHACDVARNPAFWHADARTKDAHDKTVAEYVRFGEYKDYWPQRLTQLVTAAPSEVGRMLGTEPVKLAPISRRGKSDRIVGVPTFFRRAFSNLVRDVLEKTGDELLPENVRGYRPRRPEAVRTAILDVAEAVKNQRIRYWAKLDFSSYFSVMPWAGIEEALKHYGYDGEFVAQVMTAVRCPLVRRDKHGKLQAVENKRGAQMGLAESSTLANMLPWQLDEHFGRLAPRVYYDRYSDDIFIASAIKSEVVGGVRAVIHWAKEHGIKLKGVSPDQKAESLVHDVKQQKTTYLGAEIDQHGQVHMPVEKLKEKLREIDYRQGRLALDDVIEGVSRYGGGKGVDVFDDEDVEQLIEGFLSYWEHLDPRGHAKAEALINKTYPKARSPRSGGPGKVWAAMLWAAQANKGAKTLDPLVQDQPKDDPDTTHRTPPTAASERVTPKEGEIDPVGTNGMISSDEGGLDRTTDAEPTLVDGTTAGGQESYTPREADDDLRDGLEGFGDGLLSPWEEMSQEASPSTDKDDVDPLQEADVYETSRFSTPSQDHDLDMDDLSLLERESFDKITQGAGGGPLPSESSTGADAENAMIVFDARRLPDGGSVVGSVWMRAGRVIGLPRTWVVQRCRSGAAILRAMIDLVERSGVVRRRELRLGMPSPQVAKALLQKHRKFHAPLNYLLVVGLHEAARGLGVGVTVLGGIEPPDPLTRAIEREARVASSRVKATKGTSR